MHCAGLHDIQIPTGREGASRASYAYLGHRLSLLCVDSCVGGSYSGVFKVRGVHDSVWVYGIWVCYTTLGCYHQ